MHKIEMEVARVMNESFKIQAALAHITKELREVRVMTEYQAKMQEKLQADFKKQQEAFKQLQWERLGKHTTGDK